METATVLVHQKDTKNSSKYKNEYFQVQLPEYFTEDLRTEAAKNLARQRIEKLYREILILEPRAIVSAKFDRIETQFKSSM